MEILANRLRALRAEKKLTQEQAAQEIGMVMRTYRRYEMGEREPGASTLIKMADYYGVTIDYLVGRTDRRT